ncbi:MAG: hypothetical protein ABI591_30725, partial [Kofleriaceae bacterium]
QPQGSGRHVRPSSEPTSSPGLVRPTTSPSDRNTYPRGATPVPARASSQDDQSPGALASALPQASALLLPELEPPTSVSLKKKSGSLGPLLLLIVLLGGGGALAYMMLNNADKTSPSQGGVDEQPSSANVGSAPADSATPNAHAVGSAGSAIVPQIVQPVPAVGSDETQKADVPPTGSAGSAVVGQKPNAGSKQHPTSATVRHPPVATADDKPESKAVILKQIQEAEAHADWSQLRIAYQKLGKVKGMQAQALYGEAFAAFQMNDPAAEGISTKAGAIAGPFRLKALMLHADVIFKQGDTKRAKDNYISLRALAGDKEFKATVTKKIALCNNKLGLAERDGISN